METAHNLGNQISKYYKSFSGTDTLAFIMMPGSTPVVIGSLTTMSYSMFRNKKPVINIGRTNINGVTRGARIFAGTMVFTLINQHWLKELQDQLDWLSGYDELKVDELPLFDLMIVSANEYGNYAYMYIYGIDFTDEAQTVSVEDLFTENTFSFVARDISNFQSGDINATTVKKSSNKSKYSEYTQKLYVLSSSNISLDEVAKLEYELAKAKTNTADNLSKLQVLTRDLYYSTSNVLMGNDVANIQELLNQTKLFTIPVNGIFDEATENAVKEYQSIIGEDIDGIVDIKLYNQLINQSNESDNRTGVVVNKYGAYVYRTTSLNADIVDTKAYKEQVTLNEFIINDTDGYTQKWYRIGTGYIVNEDIYSSYYTGDVIEFPTLKYGDSSAYVTLVQSALSDIDDTFTTISGTYDINTQNAIKSLQEENGIYPSGIVDNATWLLLQSLSGNVTNQISNDNFEMTFTTLPGTYNIQESSVLDEATVFDITASCNNIINIKVTAISLYENNEIETMSKTYQVKELTTISFLDFKKSLLYSITNGSMPKQITYIVYPYNKKPYKWTLNLVKEV